MMALGRDEVRVGWGRSKMGMVEMAALRRRDL